MLVKSDDGLQLNQEMCINIKIRPFSILITVLYFLWALTYNFTCSLNIVSYPFRDCNYLKVLECLVAYKCK